MRGVAAVVWEVLDQPSPAALVVEMVQRIQTLSTGDINAALDALLDRRLVVAVKGEG